MTLLRGLKAAAAKAAWSIALAPAIDFELSESDASLPQKLELVARMNKRWAQQHHVERAQDFNARQGTFAVRNADGTGACRLERHVPHIRTTLKAFPQWWNRASADKGNVDSASFVTIRSDAILLAALHSDEVDRVLDPPYQDVEPLRHDPALAVTRIGDISTDTSASTRPAPRCPACRAARTGDRATRSRTCASGARTRLSTSTW